MSIVGAGAASGGATLLPEVLAFSSSLPLDKALLKEDVIGSLAHLIMLARTGIVPRETAARIRDELLRVFEKPLPEEEDVHMAVETLLTRALGEEAGMLHTARSRGRRCRSIDTWCASCCTSAASRRTGSIPWAIAILLSISRMQRRAS